MSDNDPLFDALHALCDDAYDRGMGDLSAVLEFALDVYLLETERLQRSELPAPPLVLERPRMPRSAQPAQSAQPPPTSLPNYVSSNGITFSMSQFPLAAVMRRAS